MKRTRPAAGWPHEQPGYVFYTPELRRWLCNYEPQVAEAMCRGRSTTTDSLNSQLSREAQIAKGTGWASGTFPGVLSNRTPKVEPKAKMALVQRRKVPA